MVTIQDAQIYSMNKEMAYQITYSEGTKIRVVESSNKFIRTEFVKNGEWVANKPYVVKANNKRQAEKLKESVLSFIKGN